LLRFKKVDTGAIVDNPTEAEVLLPPGVKSKVTGRSKIGTTLVIDLEQVGTDEPSKSMDAGVLALLLGIGGAGAALAPVEAQAAERPPPPANPESSYSMALRENATGGRALISQYAAKMVRGQQTGGKPGKGLAGFTGRRSLPDAFADSVEMIRALAGDPQELIGRLSSSVGSLATTHPSVYGAMVTRAANVVAYLQGTMPQPVGRSMANPDGYPPSFDEMYDWGYRFLGAARPEQTMRDISRGEAASVQIEAFSANWPELMQQYRTEVAGTVVRMGEEGSPVNPERLAELDRSLGFDGQLDPSQSTAMAHYLLGVIEDVEARTAEQGAGKTAPSGSQSTRYQTRLGAIRSDRMMN
jgi:hypothetical protein